MGIIDQVLNNPYEGAGNIRPAGSGLQPASKDFALIKFNLDEKTFTELSMVYGQLILVGMVEAQVFMKKIVDAYVKQLNAAGMTIEDLLHSGEDSSDA